MNQPGTLPFSLRRTVLIRATPETVFRFFIDSERWAKWWGAGSTVDARTGGRVYIKHPGGVEAEGEILVIDPPRQITFTYGYPSRPELPPGSSRVTITLDAHPTGTRLNLEHELANEKMRDEHVQGWRFQLSLFANAVSNEVNADAATAVDAWFEMWSDPDEQSRTHTVASIASPDITMSDQYSCLSTIPDLLAHIAAAQRFMPGVRMKRSGSVRHCLGYALADYVATAADGRDVMRGTNIFVFDAVGMLETVVGITARA